MVREGRKFAQTYDLDTEKTHQAFSVIEEEKLIKYEQSGFVLQPATTDYGKSRVTTSMQPLTEEQKKKKS